MLSNELKNKIIDYLKNEIYIDQWDIVGPGIESNDSVVYKFACKNHSKAYALKRYHPEKTNKIMPHYSALERFAKLLNKSDSNYRVSAPVFVFLEDHCFLMEWVEGHSLKDTLWKHCFNKNKLQTHITAASLWLHTYHQSADMKLKSVDTNRYLNNLQNHINASNNESYFLSETVFSDAKETLINFQNKIGDVEAIHADLHGDLNLANLIVNENCITGIDISATDHLPVEDDLAQMLNYICVNYFNMLTRFDIQKPQNTWEIFNVVLDAYGYPKETKSRDFFLYVFMYQMLYRWVSIKNTHEHGKEKNLTFYLLGKWRLYNSKVIVENLNKVINLKIKNNAK